MTDVKLHSIWRHRKRGTEYEVLDTNTGLQCSSFSAYIENIFEHTPLVTYRSLGDGRVWVRPLREWDSRFELVRCQAQRR